MNNNRVSIKHLFVVLGNLLILLFLIFLTASIWENTNIVQSNWALFITKITIPLLLIHLMCFKIKKINYLDFRFWFIILTYLFMFGRVFLNAFDADKEIFWNLIVRHNKVDLYHTSLIILNIIQAIFLGFIIRDDKNNYIKILDINENKVDKAMYKTGITLLIMSAPFRLFVDTLWIIQAQMNSSYTTEAVTSGLVEHFAMLIVPAIILMILSGQLKRRHSTMILGMIILYFLATMILTGDRRYPVTAIFALVLSYMRVYKSRLSTKQYFFYGISSFYLLNFLAVVRNARFSSLTNLGDFIKTYSKDIFLGRMTIYETLAEFGLTFFSVVHIYEYVPKHIPFQRGYSFIASMPSILPVGRIFRELFSKASLSEIINPLVNTPVGGSLIGDLYGNFSWGAIVVAFVFGVVINKMLYIDPKKARRSAARYYSLFFILLNLVRATFFEIVRPAFMVYFIPLIIMKCYSRATDNSNEF